MKRTCIFFLILFGLSFKHPFYLSVTDLKYKSQEKALQGSVKIFLNDLEDALSKIQHQTVDLINIKDSVKTNKILEEYLKKRLKFRINSASVNYSYLGFEKEQEAIWLYIEIKNCSKPIKVEIENSILYDYLKNQSNIVHFDLDGNKKSTKVNCPEKQIDLEF